MMLFRKTNMLKYKKGLNYLVVLFSLLYNVSPFFGGAWRGMWFILFLFLLYITNFVGLRMFNSKIVLVIIAVWFLILYQGLALKSFSPAAFYKPVMLFLTPFLIYRLLGPNYFKYLFYIIYVAAWVTICLWLLQNLFKNIQKN